MPEFVNPKYANEERTIFKKPTRLECMMQVTITLTITLTLILTLTLRSPRGSSA